MNHHSPVGEGGLMVLNHHARDGPGSEETLERRRRQRLRDVRNVRRNGEVSGNGTQDVEEFHHLKDTMTWRASDPEEPSQIKASDFLTG